MIVKASHRCFPTHFFEIVGFQKNLILFVQPCLFEYSVESQSYR